MDLAAVRTELEQIVARSGETIAVLEADSDSETGRDDEFATEEPKADDATGDRIQADREDALAEVADERRAEAVAALARLDDGTYGTCVVCGKPIEAGRLEARPEAARCLADQEALEAA